MLFALGPGLTSDRYYPPLIKGRLAIIYRLLAMFHPRPFLLTRFGPQGTVACIQAENKDYLDIVFRSLLPYILYILYANDKFSKSGIFVSIPDFILAPFQFSTEC